MISVILITYNGEEFVEKAISSVLSQSIGLSHIQLVIVDDNSSDETAAILRRYMAEYPDNVVVYEKRVNTIIAKDSSRDIGLSLSKGKYVLFLDQDDWYLPDAFEKLYIKMEEYPFLDFIEYSFDFVDENMKVFKSKNKGNGEFEIYDVESDEDYCDLVVRKIKPCSTYVWSKIYRKDFLIMNNIHHNEGDQYSGFGDNYFSGLVEINCRRFAIFRETIYQYRVWLGSWSHSGKKNDSTLFERLKVGYFFLEECKLRGYIFSKKKLVEFLFLRIFLEKTFYRIINEFDPLPYSILRQMQEYILHTVPEYKKNELVFSRKALRRIVDNLDEEWNEEYIQRVKSEINS